MPGPLDETYLGTLCHHLATEPPTDGPWVSRARGWAVPGGGTTSGAWLRASGDPSTLYPAALEAGLPLPLTSLTENRRQIAAEENALGAVLAVFAALVVTAPGRRAHLPGGPSIGTVLGGLTRRGGVHDMTVRATMRELGRAGRQAMSRLVHDAGRARGSQVDLRTVAALAYGTPGNRPQQLSTNPTGRWPGTLDGTSTWTPVAEVLRDAVFASYR
ncbi:hypothetical protein DR950_18140 [Kitasatospora xanthocidica]|uniref:Uncharacterized protein n=1 Tax=Kitasatospora xanthocidica TaxID=83382 RepID=A0A372ZU59_9ACTN|nr:hypothetical protein [Kitasatospora xanthocidica]RGD59458.1 hypothetical protein DR950_18140 [Kitasatospora xanthocidica]